MPLRFTHRILDHLAHARYRPAHPNQLAKDLGVDSDDQEVFEQAIEALRSEDRLEIGNDGLVRLPVFGSEIEGRLRLTQRGFGFVIPDTPHRDGDLFIPAGKTRDGISGDRVRVRVIHQKWRAKSDPGRSPFVGEVIEVVDRGRAHVVGTLVTDSGSWFVHPSDRSMHEPVLIRDPHAKNAKAGDKVVIEMVHYPEADYVPEGVIVRVLGEAGRPDVETEAVIAAHGLRREFPDAVLRAASDAARGFDPTDRAGREDLTETLIFTIDPPDAKDYDDAISIDFDRESEQWTLGVHIADVSHFVRPGSPLDGEAQERGNSAYLPRLVIPMLPETLSNGVCSLQEGVGRYAKSVFISFDKKGRVTDQRLAATIIESSKRLTYLEAQALIDGDVKTARQHAKTETNYTDELMFALRQSDRLARTLRKRRNRDGMIVLDLPEVELVFDDEGHVIDAVPEDDAFTHKIIEMFMVEANEAVARTFDAIEVPILRRIHPDPVAGDIEELRMYARAQHINLPDEPDRHDLQRLLDKTRDTPASRAIHFAVLRTLTAASYSPAIIGHFALASEHYAHFTSPIRRYPDLQVHRVIEAFLERTENGRRVPGGKRIRVLGQQLRDDDRVPGEEDLVALGRQCTDTEGQAEQAERALREFLVMQFLEKNHLGDEFDGVVSGVTGNAIYVSIERYLIEGMIRIGDLPRPPGGSDRQRGQWKADSWRGRIVAPGTPFAITVGDLVRVKVARVDPPARHLDLQITALPEAGASTHAPPTEPRRRSAGHSPRGGKGKRKGHKQGRRGKRGSS